MENLIKQMEMHLSNVHLIEFNSTVIDAFKAINESLIEIKQKSSVPVLKHTDERKPASRSRGGKK